VVAFSNCKDESLTPSVIINVEEDFYIDMFEDISNGEKVFNITIKSIQNQECLNTIIDYHIDINEEEAEIILSINDILDPETCDFGNAPAFVSIPFEKIPEKDYGIHINLKDVVFNNGTLFASSKKYRLFMYAKDGFQLLHENLYKIPEKTIWGYIGYEEESGRTQADNFIKDLKNLVTNIEIAPVAYDTGYYGYFNLLEGKSITLEKEIEENFLSTFIFYNEDDSHASINSLLDDYCDSNPNLSFYVFTSEGEELNCE